MGYIPNLAIHPGKTIAELLDREGMTQKNLCERMGISEKHLSQIINGEASITAETALLLENALGGSASFWINLEQNYKEVKARLERESLVINEHKLLTKFPYNELAKRLYVEKTPDKSERVLNLWKFFGVNSLESIVYTESIAFRKKESVSIKSESIAAWLRCGEIESKKQLLSDYSESELKRKLSLLKQLSTVSPDLFQEEVTAALNQAGVGIVFIKHFPSTGVSGAVRWINNNPLIQLSLYYAYADIFWFNLFHEIGHIILHGKKDKFLEFDDPEIQASNSQKEEQANQFAADQLIPPKEYQRFFHNKVFSQHSITKFAEELEVHRGIVAGRLCHDNKLSWAAASQLRQKLKFSN